MQSVAIYDNKELTLKKSFAWADAPVDSAFPIARPGYPLIAAAAFVTAVLAMLELTVPALLGLVVTVFICMFFRDPDRVIPTDPNAVVSPADGKVIGVDDGVPSPFHETPCRRVCIFMSVFNVHVNRIPCDGTIRSVHYTPGKFVSANLDKASTDNEQNALLLETADGASVAFVQIAGLVARRIICRVQAGDEVNRGQRFGMICFGSRLNVYLPVDSRVDVTVGQHVSAGTSILGYLS